MNDAALCRRPSVRLQGARAPHSIVERTQADVSPELDDTTQRKA